MAVCRADDQVAASQIVYTVGGEAPAPADHVGKSSMRGDGAVGESGEGHQGNRATQSSGSSKPKSSSRRNGSRGGAPAQPEARLRRTHTPSMAGRLLSALSILLPSVTLCSQTKDTSSDSQDSPKVSRLSPCRRFGLCRGESELLLRR